MALPKDHITAAEQFIGEDVEFTRLAQIFDLQRLLGPVIAYKILLEISINSSDSKERLRAASRLLDAVDEDPEKLADRLRASRFDKLNLRELEAMVQTGITDPEKAMEALDRTGLDE